MGYGLQERGLPTVDESKCSACGQCVATCPDEVLSRENGKIKVGRGLFLGCIACGHCMAVCPKGAISVSGRGMRPDDCMELPLPERRATADQLEALAVARRSVRKFQAREVSREILERIVRVATAAPMGIPPHEVGVSVFTNRASVQAFTADACRSFEKMGRFFNPFVLGLMRPFIGKYQYEVFRHFIRPLLEMLPTALKQGHDKFTYDAPAAMLFHVGPMGDAADCTIVATYAMLAAEALGLGSCMLGTSVALTRDKPLKLRYGIPEENKVGVALIVGYPAVEFRRAIRRRLACVKYVD